MTIEQLLQNNIELNVQDGIILPNLKMTRETNRCSFLNEEGRCTIHAHRPGMCRIFPLGRVYENNSFQYILQVHECKNTNRSKIKVSKWIDTPNLKENQKFINDWHYFIKGLQTIAKSSEDAETVRNMNLYVLNMFYFTPYSTDTDFYVQFYQRLEEANRMFDTN